MSSPLRRGLVAGAAGTTALNAVTYLDMALRGRAASPAPAETVDALASALGRTVPGDGHQRDNRRESLGAVLGTATGVGVGVLAAVARSAGLRLPTPLAAVATGAAAMAAADVPMTVLGVGDPRTWTMSDWLADVVPHLVYGATTHSVVVALDRDLPPRRATTAVVLRSAVLGVATGGRSSVALAAPARAVAPGSLKARAGLLGLAVELVGDKLPTTPSRLQAPSLSARVAAGAGGGAALAKADGCASAVPALAGAVGALAGSYGGAAWRTWSATRMPPTLAAVLEDGVAVTMAVLASRAARPTEPPLPTPRGIRW